MDTTTIRREALSLPPQERAALARDLLSSLEAESHEDIDQLWLDEAVRRAEEVDRGEARTYSSEEVSSQARSLLR
jgi:putative addiction module component (TIGR02574 family)